MLGLFKKKVKNTSSVSPQDALIASLRDRLARMSHVDRIALGGQEMFEFLMRPHKDDTEPRLPIQIFLCIASMLAGYAAQTAARITSPGSVLTVDMKDGQRFYIGDTILQKLFFEQYYSPWPFVGGGMDQIGKVKEFQAFDIQERVAHSTQIMGSEDFFHIRVPEQHQPDVLPPKALADLWEACSEHLGAIVPDRWEWPGCYGIVLQHAIIHSKNIIDPNIALAIIAESMLIASKLDLPLKEK